MTNSDYSGNGKLKQEIYDAEIARLQAELLKLQYWIRAKGLKVCVIFEGRDAAGKGGVIKRIIEPLNPRTVRIVALPKPTEKERNQWYFQRYVEQLPTAGEMVLFDRSWYNRAGVEKVMGFCTEDEYQEFLRACPQFEEMIQRSGVILIKYWFSISDKEQKKRFLARNEDPMKRWKLSPMDVESRRRWVDYSKAKDEMFKHTDTETSPWYVVNADIKRHARLNCISHLLDQIEYEDLTPDPIVFPKITKHPEYQRPPIESMNWVPAKFGENPVDDERS
ncbi:MAG: polyphosphate kinase 2 [Balneola sp.]